MTFLDYTLICIVGMVAVIGFDLVVIAIKKSRK